MGGETQGQVLGVVHSREETVNTWHPRVQKLGQRPHQVVGSVQRDRERMMMTNERCQKGGQEARGEERGQRERERTKGKKTRERERERDNIIRRKSGRRKRAPKQKTRGGKQENKKLRWKTKRERGGKTIQEQKVQKPVVDYHGTPRLGDGLQHRRHRGG